MKTKSNGLNPKQKVSRKYTHIPPKKKPIAYIVRAASPTYTLSPGAYTRPSLGPFKLFRTPLYSYTRIPLRLRTFPKCSDSAPSAPIDLHRQTPGPLLEQPTPARRRIRFDSDSLNESPVVPSRQSRVSSPDAHSNGSGKNLRTPRRPVTCTRPPPLQRRNEGLTSELSE